MVVALGHRLFCNEVPIPQNIEKISKNNDLCVAFDADSLPLVYDGSKNHPARAKSDA